MDIVNGFSHLPIGCCILATGSDALHWYLDIEVTRTSFFISSYWFQLGIVAYQLILSTFMEWCLLCTFP